MRAVFKKELHTYSVTMIGAAALAILLLLTGFVTRYVNYFTGYASYAYTLQNLSFWFYMIATPLLTMRTFSEEYRQKTDQLLFTAPVRVRQIVYGKFAALAVFLMIPVLFMAVYAGVLGTYGKMPVTSDRTALLLFFLMGLAYFAVGMLLSSVTENQIIAAVLSVLFILLTQLIGNLRSVISASRTGGLVFVMALILLFSVVLYAASRKKFLCAVVFLVLMIAAILLFILAGSWYDGRISTICSIFDFRTMFFTGAMGTLDLRAILFFLSYTAAGIELTVYAVTRRMKDVSAAGMAFIPVLLLNILLLNLIAGRLPVSVTVRDLTPQKLYTTGEVTKKTAEALTEDVTLYFLTAYGEEDKDIEALLSNYESLSGHIFVKKVDLAASPRFPEQFGEESLPRNSVIVSSAGKYRILRYESFYPVSAGNAYANDFDGEGQITSAISYVTDPSGITLYCTRGHGEPQFDAAMTDAAAKMNIDTESCDLLAGGVPENADALAVFAPAKDFTEEEAAAVRKYLEEGGALFITTMYTQEEMPVLRGILNDFGIDPVPGYVFEEDAGSYAQLPYLLLPVIMEYSEVTAGFPQETLLYPFAQGITLTKKEGVSAAPLLRSGEKSFARSDPSERGTTRTEKDAEGPFYLAASAEAENGARIVYFTTPCVFSKSILTQFLQSEMSLPSGNASLFARSLSYVTGRNAEQAISPKSMTAGALLIPAGAAVRFGILSMAVIPGLILLAGAVIWVRRRRR